nr:hypothetical protein [uncultured Carboxylicivirga sp.]
MCLVEILLNTVANYYDLENLITDRCSVEDNDNIEEELEDVNEEDGDENEKIEVTNLPITNIRTFIDLEGNVKISWVNPNQDCITKLEYLIPDKEPTEVNLSRFDAGEYSYNIDKSESGARITGMDSEIDYIITGTNPNLNFKFQSKTGKFQGHDHAYCAGLYVNVGSKENQNKTPGSDEDWGW